MWRRTAFIVALGIAISTRAKSQGHEPECPAFLFSELNWVRFDVSMGRVLAAASRTKQDRQRVRREHPSGATETLAVTIDRGLTSLRYEFTGAEQSIVIHVTRRDCVRIHWSRTDHDGRPITVAYLQPAQGNVQLSIRSGDSLQQDFQCASLWHLLLAHPEPCGKYLVAILEGLRPDWSIQNDVAAIRSAMFERDRARQTTSRREVTLLVEQLADENYQLRQRADRQLRSRGYCVLGFLNELAPNSLDAEQRLRIKGIQKVIETRTDDTPMRVAAWLANDRSAWIVLLSDDDPSRRRMASEQLARLCNQAIHFDPDASESVRMRQIADLRGNLMRR